MKTEDRGRPARPVDYPARLPQDLEDVVSLNILQGRGRPVDNFGIALAK